MHYVDIGSQTSMLYWSQHHYKGLSQNILHPSINNVPLNIVFALHYFYLGILNDQQIQLKSFNKLYSITSLYYIEPIT